MKTTTTAEVKYVEHFRGWLAFRSGKALRSVHNHIKVFRTEEEAVKAAKKSKRI